MATPETSGATPATSAANSNSTRVRSSTGSSGRLMRGRKPVLPVPKDAKYRVFKALRKYFFFTVLKCDLTHLMN